MSETQEQSTTRRTFVGAVVSAKMDKTVVVEVTRRFRHPRYKKYVKERLRYKAHDEKNDAKQGDRVRIVETRPLSREKRWAIEEILERAPVV